MQKKNNRQFTYGQTVQKTALENLQCSRQCKKTATAIYIWTDSAKKQQQFTYGQYIFTDCTEDNVQNTHCLLYSRGFRMKPMEERKSLLKQQGICFKCCSSLLHMARNCDQVIVFRMWQHYPHSSAPSRPSTMDD